MENTSDILVDRMTGRSSDEGLETDLSAKEKVDRYLGAQMELDAALLAREAGANQHDRADIDEAVAILDHSARHWAGQISEEELDSANHAGEISGAEYQAVKDRKSDDLQQLALDLADEYDIDTESDRSDTDAVSKKSRNSQS